MHMMLAVILFLVSLTQAYVNWEIKGTATKEQHLPAAINAKTTCDVTLSYKKASDSLGADVNCGTGLGSNITAAHIHFVGGQKPLPVDFAPSSVIFTLLAAPLPIEVTTFTYLEEVNETELVQICNNLCYINIHCLDPSYNVRLNLVGMDYICGDIGKEASLTAGTTSWGPAPTVVGLMQSWVTPLDLYPNGDSTKSPACTGRLSYQTGDPMGKIFYSGWCNFINSIESCCIGKDNGTECSISLFDETPGFYGKIPFTFNKAINNTERDTLCAAGDWDVFLQTDVGSYSGKIALTCPAVGAGPPPPTGPTPPTPPTAPVKTAAGTLSFAVYLTVFIALLMKWLF
jgi:hypothetical protein